MDSFWAVSSWLVPMRPGGQPLKSKPCTQDRTPKSVTVKPTSRIRALFLQARVSETGFSSPCRVAVHPQSSGRRGLARDHSRTFFRAFVVKRLRLFVLWLEGIRFRICGTVQRVSESRLMYCYDVFKEKFTISNG